MARPLDVQIKSVSDRIDLTTDYISRLKKRVRMLEKKKEELQIKAGVIPPLDPEPASEPLPEPAPQPTMDNPGVDELDI
jgi:hypothetical protein